MDLKIKDVAELLNVSEKKIYELIEEGKIPAYKLNDKYRFNRTEIENWVLNQKKVNPFSTKHHYLKLKETQKIIKRQIGSQAFALYKSIYKGGVIFDKGGDDKKNVIKRSVDIIAKNLNLDAEVLLELLMDREKLMPTALNNGIAIPHTRDFLLPKPYDVVTVVYLDEPIEYGALDQKKVDLLFFLFACNDKKHLHLLAKIAHLANSKKSFDFLKSKPEKEQLLSYIKKWEATVKSPANELC